MEALPTLVDHGRPGTSTLLRKQVSQFFHGRSVLRSDPSKPQDQRGRTQNRKFWPRVPRQPRGIHVPYHRHWPDATVPRSPSSTRSIIDPYSSPPGSSSPFPQMPWPTSTASTAVTRPIGSSRKWSSKLSIAKLRMQTSSFRSLGFCTKMKNKTVKKKAIVCLVSGIILAILLVIC